MKRLAFMTALLVTCVLSFSAYAQAPDFRCAIETSDYTAPSIDDPVFGDTTHESLTVYYRNKGNEDATDVKCHLYAPNHATLTSGNSILDMGTVTAPDNFPSALNFQYEVDLDAKPYSKMKWKVECTNTSPTYTSDWKTYTTTCNKTVKVRPRLERTIIDEHDGWVDVHPETKKIAYSERNNDQVYIYDTVAGTTTQLTFGGDEKHKPLFSPDGKKLAFMEWDETTWNNNWTWIMNIDGTDGTTIHYSSNDMHHVAWSADSKNLYIHNCFTDDLEILPVSGGTPTTFIPTQFQPGGDVYKDLLAFRNRNTEYLELYQDDGTFLTTLDFWVNTSDGEFQPGSAPARLLFRGVDSHNSNSQLFTLRRGQKDPKCLTCLKSKTEYQLSSDADTIYLDHDNVIEIKGVWKDGDVGGYNYWSGSTAEPPYDPALTGAITLPEPLSDNPADQVAVRVTYRYMPYYCNAKAHYNKSGNVIAYKSREPGYHSIWAMQANGTNRIRLTFNNADSYGRSKTMPRVVNGGKHILFSSYAYGSSHLTLLKLDANARQAIFWGVSDDDDDDDDSKCGMVENHPNPLGFIVVLFPLLALYFLRRRAMVE